MTPSIASELTNIALGLLVLSAMMYSGFRVVRWMFLARPFQRVTAAILPAATMLAIIVAWIMGVGLVIALLGAAARFWSKLL